MDWMEYLRAERARKIESISLLSTLGSKRVTISRTQSGIRTELNDEMIAQHEAHIAEIDEILSAAERKQ